MVAPDLERYLDPRNIDLLVTDQVEAVRVRVARGLEVFERRRLDGVAAARKSRALASSLLLLCCALGYVAGPPRFGDVDAGVWRWVMGGVSAIGALWAASVLVRTSLDIRRLRRLAGRFTPRDLDDLGSSREVLDYGEKALEEARTLGAVPE